MGASHSQVTNKAQPMCTDIIFKVITVVSWTIFGFEKLRDLCLSFEHTHTHSNTHLFGSNGQWFKNWIIRDNKSSVPPIIARLIATTHRKAHSTAPQKGLSLLISNFRSINNKRLFITSFSCSSFAACQSIGFGIDHKNGKQTFVCATLYYDLLHFHFCSQSR